MEVLKETKSEQRNIQFQKSFNGDKLRRKREETMISLRKQKRSLHILKKRFLESESQKPESQRPAEFLMLEESWISSDLSTQYPDLINSSLPVASRLSVLITCIASIEDSKILHQAIQTLRKVLACESIPPLHFIMNSGISKRLITLLTTKDKDLQKETLWCIINLATGPSHIVRELVSQGAVDQLKALLQDSDEEVIELTIWCIGNLAGDCIETRDLLVNVVPDLVGQIDKIPSQKWKNVMWTLSNLCRGKPLPERSITSQVLSVVNRVLSVNEDEIIADCCWALSYISDGDHQRVQDLIDLNIVPHLISLLSKDSVNIIIPSLRTLGSIVAGTDQQTQIALNCGLVDKIFPFLTSKKVFLKREALWTLSNITAGTDEQINLVLSHPCIHTVIESIKDPDFEIKKEALWTVSNATNATSASISLKVYEFGALGPISDILEMKDSKILMVALEAINNLLKAGAAVSGDNDAKVNEVANKFDYIGGLSKMEALQEHPNVKIYNKVVEIIDQNYGLIEVNDENDAPLPQQFVFN